MKKDIWLIVTILMLYGMWNTAYAVDSRSLRIISLAPATTEVLFALGLDAEIVGVSLSCNYPERVAAKEKVGTFSQPDIEKILSLKPDIIFCTGLEQAPAITKLRDLNLKFYISDPSNMEELFDSIGDMGELVGRKKEAAVLIGKMKADIEQVTSEVKSIPKKNWPKVFVEIWHEPLLTAGRGSFLDQLIAMAGGINIAYDIKKPYANFSPEQVIKRDPDCVIAAYMNSQNIDTVLMKRLGWDKISAVKNKRIYNDINSDLFLRPGPRITEGLKEIHKRLYLK